MILEQHVPTGNLAMHVDALMHFSHFVPDHTIERVVPTGNVFIIFELDGFTRHTYNNETLQPDASYRKVWISGMRRNHLSISAHENSSMFVIQFKAAGAYPFLHIPIEELTEKIVPAEDVVGSDVLHLREHILNAETVADKFMVAETWLNNRYDYTKAPSGDISNVLEKLQKEPVTNLNNILATFPNTQKHLIDLFKKHVGLTPKYYQRILRFNEILQRIQHKEKITWTDIAYSCGYSDQSHFIKEFKHFSGFNPKEFINQSHNNQQNFFPLDREG